MKLDNKTRWNTDDLRAIISAALRVREVPSTGLVVEVVPSRRRGEWKVTDQGSVWESSVRDSVTGRATLGRMVDAWVTRAGLVPLPRKEMRYGRWMILRLPNPDKVTRGLEVLRKHFAQVVEHEVGHLQGLDHTHMSEALMYCTQDVPWLGELQLTEAPEIVHDKAAARSGRLEHAQAMLGKAMTREKRATTLRKKWERRVRALERTGES